MDFLIEQLKEELKQYYATISSSRQTLPFNPLRDRMDAFAAAHPELSPMMLKANQYEIIADGFEPVLFRNDPFYFETGLKLAEYDGHSYLSSGGWLLTRNHHLFGDQDPVVLEHYCAAQRLGLHLALGPYCDYDHHCFPYTNVLGEGLSGILQKVEEGAQQADSPEKSEFFEAARRGLLALKKIAENFADVAEKRVESSLSPEEAGTYRQIAETARKVPWNPPATFYEGLAAMWFLHELGSTMDGVGMSVMGSPDRLLGELYRRDLAAGRLTRDGAYKLISIYLIHTDCKLQFDKPVEEQFNSGEQGDTLILGGIDADGNEILNDVTFLILDAHRNLNLIYPKLHCRVSSQTSPEFLRDCSKDFLCGRNLISFLNDDLLIPALQNAGKESKDAVNYVAGGCWETIVESCEHSEGANCYFSLAKTLDLTIQSTEEEEKALNMHFDRPDEAASFEELYRVCMENTKRTLGKMLATIARYGKIWPQVNPAPLFSACLSGCLESGLDYTAGGAKYSPHGVPLTGLAILINSLLALKKLCFEEKKITMPEYLSAVRENWEGHEALRLQAISSSHFGDGSGEGSALGTRILNELADFVASFRNERNGIFQCGLYSYVDIVRWAAQTGATPDGRKRGDFLAQGLTPTRLHGDDVPAIFRDIAALPLDRFPANSVLTLSLSRSGLDEQRLADLIRIWCRMKAGGMFQLNCVSREELEDAIHNPEDHRDLIVRLYGYSAHFTKLDSERQQEFLTRKIL